MGFELGPGFLRRPPSGWLPGHAFAVEHRTSHWPNNAQGLENISQSVRLDALWEVRLDGREAYRFEDDRRTAPLWCASGGLSGKRWYRLRVKNSYGLLGDVPIPVHVNPENGWDMWVDWDAAYQAHVEAWERHDRVELAKARRAGKVEGIAERITNPFAGKLRPGEEALVEQSIEEDRRREAELEERLRPQREAQLAKMGFGPVGEDEQSEYKRRREEMERVYRDGRPAKATVIANAPAGRTLANIPVVLITFEIHDGPAPRRLEYEHVWGPRHAKRLKVGKQVDVHVDPADPNLICPA
jgi:hypothetical protein